ncbi:hypothetical protein GOD58_18255 [Sinorhizobium medicae]|nr:hypothetical protein [Sinorhizobium medicae]MDX0850138.1 hypothetical protein [Sinorhizobium medicae]MDX1014864.1 hypothetical protein [Sinorhizobium medicae]
MGAAKRTVARLALTVALTDAAVAQTFEFAPESSHPAVKDVLDRRSQGEESAEDVIFDKCQTIGLKIDLSEVPQFSSYAAEEKARIETNAERTITPVSIEKACSITYSFKSAEAEMRVLLYPRSRIEYLNLEGEESGGALLNYCAEVDPDAGGGTFTSQLSDEADPEPVNSSTLNFCEAGVPVQIRTSCDDVTDKRCQDEDLIKGIRKAVRIVAVPSGK